MGTHIFQIVIMLLVAAILGFLIAWFWCKTKIESLNDKINSLEAEKNSAQKLISDKEHEIDNYQQKFLDIEKAVNKEPPSEEEAALNRIKEKSKEINFNRIGVATEKDKDDLKIISGIGPFIEKKLNALGIYTFRQIANFTEEDREKVNDAIEFFPGRIMRDDWIGQAKKIINKD